MSNNAVEPVSRSAHAQRCPWWIGWVLASPLRRLLEKPEELVIPFVESGARVLEIGPGMGYFTLPMAERVGQTGRIICVDVQPQMLSALRRRLFRKGLTARVDLRQCTETDLGVADMAESIDLAVLIHVLHEVGDPRRILRDIVATLRPNGKLLFAEPKGHVSSITFQAELAMAREEGLVPCDTSAYPSMRGRQTALLERVAR